LFFICLDFFDNHKLLTVVVDTANFSAKITSPSPSKGTATMNQEFDNMLNFDPIDFAEKLTGNSYKDDNDTANLALGIAIQHNAQKSEMLAAAGDSTFSNEIGQYIRIIEDIGFECVASIPFVGKSPWEDERKETLYLYAHRDLGILLKFDTFNGDHVNSGNFYYCWKPNDCENHKWMQMTSSGTLREDENGEKYWVGYHDCREAIRYHINQLKKAGTFIQKWPKNNKAWLWLLNYMDTKNPDYNYKEINQSRVKLMPEWVQEMINR